MSSTITVRTDWYEMIQNLSTEGKAELLDAIYLYNLGEHGSLKDSSVKLIRPGIQKYYEDLKKRRVEKSVSTDKKKYLEFVKLTDEEYSKLVELFGEYGAKQRIKKLNDYIGYKGKKYQSHYYTILNRAKRDVKSQKDIAIQKERAKIQRELQTLSNNTTNNGESIHTETFNRRNEIGG